jgi:hypothetical protein
MDTQDPRPAWWQLLLLLPAILGVVIVEARTPLSETVHTVATVGILALTYALVGLWVRANRLALTRANHLVTLVRQSQEKRVPGAPGEECVLVHPLQAVPSESPQGRDSVTEGDPNPPVATVQTAAETSRV